MPMNTNIQSPPASAPSPMPLSGRPLRSQSSLPRSFYCLITMELMTDPVMDPEGNSYERSAIEEWLEQDRTSPITRTQLSPTQLVPNRALKDAIEAATLQEPVSTGASQTQPSAPSASLLRPLEAPMAESQPARPPAFNPTALTAPSAPAPYQHEREVDQRGPQLAQVPGHSMERRRNHEPDPRRPRYYIKHLGAIMLAALSGGGYYVASA